MKVITYPTYKHADEADFAGKTAIVIDLLRATSTIAAALHNGAERVIPVEEVEDAKILAGSLRETGVISGGERGGAKLEGFDYGNSPLEYESAVVQGKTLVLCTTNGTRAVRKAAAADAVYMGCLNNARAVAQKAAARGRDIAILCSGTAGYFSVDDVVAAGTIISRILEITEIESMDDLSHTALWLYEKNRGDLHALLKISRPYRTLLGLEAMRDIEYCFQEDILDIVPCYADGEII